MRQRLSKATSQSLFSRIYLEAYVRVLVEMTTQMKVWLQLKLNQEPFPVCKRLTSMNEPPPLTRLIPFLIFQLHAVILILSV